MTVPALPQWFGLEAGDPEVPTAPAPHREGPLLFAVVAGSVAVVVREVRQDGRLGAAEPLFESSAGAMLIVPADRAGQVVEIRASHDASWVSLAVDDRPLPSRESLEAVLRPMFSLGSELRDWDGGVDAGTSWRLLVESLSEHLDRRASECIASAAQRDRDRIARLRDLDDRSLSEAVEVMVHGHSAPRVSAMTGRRSQSVAAILEVIEALGVSTEAARNLEPQSALKPVDHLARVLHLQYRTVRLEDRWWCDDAGPLLLERADDGTPAALIPRRGGYLAREHHSKGVRTIDRVGASHAAAYSESATMFYRPLPAGRGRLTDLLRIVFAGNLGDGIMVLAVIAVVSALVALVPIVTGQIVGTVIPSVERVQLVFFGALLVSVAISRALLHVAAGIAFLRLETRSSYQVIAALVDRVFQLPVSFFRGGSAGDLTQRVMAVEEVRSALTQSVLSICVSLLASLANLAVLFHFDASMGVTAVTVIVAELVIVAWLSVRMARADYEMSVAKGELDGFGIDMLLGIRQIQIQGSRQRTLSSFITRLGRVGTCSYRSGMFAVWVGVVVGAASTVAMALVFVEFTASLRETPALVLEPGGFVAFVTALAAFLAAVVGIAPAIKAGANMVPQIQRIRPLLSADTEVGAAGGDVVTIRGGVAARAVRFSYGPDTPYVLDGIDLDAQPGEFVAIVGRTGCGKSTLLSILLGLERPQSGQVLYDQTPLENLDAAVVRSQIGVVMQSTESIFGNVQSMILGIGSSRTIDDAWSAARMVGMADEIDAMPMGMLTVITPSSMSQSQVQRLLIARALVARPEIVFLDEATSALDNASQAEITKAIEGIGATRIVIAHRLSTIRNADRIYVLDRGRVVQSGTFDELEREGGLFSDLMAGQMS